MSLKSRALLIIGLFLLVLFALNNAVLLRVIMPGFAEIELQQARTNAARVVKAIQSDVDHLAQSVADWSNWSDTHDYVTDKNSDYEEGNLFAGALVDLNINMLLIYDAEATRVWGMLVDIEEEEEVALAELSTEALDSASPLLRHESAESEISGIIMTNQGPMIIASRPILRNDESGPINGALIMGRFLDDAVVEALREQVDVNFAVESIADPEARARRQALLQNIAESPENSWLVQDQSVVHGFTVLDDVFGNPALLIDAKTAQSITAAGSNTVHVAMASLFIVSLIVLVLIWLLLKQLVLERISRHTERVNSIQRSGDLSEQIPVDGEDEIATLARQFNAMMENLKEAREELLEQSYKLGRAEMAAGTLHNIRNAFNPLLNRVVRVAQRIESSPATNLHAAIVELLDGQPDETRAAKLRQYATMAASELAQMQDQLHAEMTAVKQHIGSIEQMLTRQNVVDEAKLPFEAVGVEEIISSALDLLPVDLSEQVKVVIDDDLADAAPVAAHKTNLVQVMQNLLINAAESIHASGSPDGEIRIMAAHTIEEGQDLVHILVTDKGVGLDETAKTAIFQRDYSTKSDGKGGLGLHWCANTVASMNGRMYAESEGLGKGATVHVLIPAAA